MIRFIRFSLYLLGVVLMAWGCSADRNTRFSRTYHNINARFNGYFLAREKMREVEAQITTEATYDYNQVLPPMVPIADATRSTITAGLEDVIKKASFAITRHKNSHYLDDCYVLIGKARYYKGEYEDAVKTFKYANSLKDKHPEAKHQAMVWLLRTYLAMEEMDNVAAVSDYLKREEAKFNHLSAKELYLTRAQMAYRLQEPKGMLENVNLALPHVKNKDEKSRLHFILGQLYQAKGADKDAYFHYSQVLKKNPPYELGFFAKLALGQVTELTNASNTRRIQKYYKRLLKDPKNKEYLDKVYYEMARFELKQNNVPQGIELLGKSARASQSNGPQKAATYLLAGQTYYNRLQNYPLAAAYYDSTTQIMDTKAPGYQAVKDRRDVLVEFAKHYTIIQTEDSLQALARMDPSALNAKVEQLMAAEEARQKAEAERLKKAEENQANQAAFLQNNPKAAAEGAGINPSPGGVFYFYNAASVGAGKSDFVRKWGRRTLSDNWRRLSQGAQAGGSNATGAEKDSVAAVAEAPKELTEAEKTALRDAARQTYLQNIPSTPALLEASNLRLQESYFALGNLYNLQLNEPLKAAETFEKLLQRFPEHPKKAEVYYSLFLIYEKANDPRKEQYRNLIIQQFPNSSYAKILANPNYLADNAKANEAVRILYDSAYTLYQKGRYPQARLLVKNTRQQYKSSDLDDRLALLQVLLLGRTDTLTNYKAGLESFIEQYKSSPLVPYAQTLLDKYNEFLNKSPDALAEVNKKKEVEWRTDLKGPHVVVVLYPTHEPGFSDMAIRFSDFNSANFSIEDLKTSDLVLNDTTSLFSVREFKDSKRALQYLDRLKGRFSPLEGLPPAAYKAFVISTENFPLFYQSKDLEQYMAFFRKKYL